MNVETAIPHAPASSRSTSPVPAASGGSSATLRSGLGADRHPFGPGGPLVLGGVEIRGAPALHGHSDGDVALHAVADALLGATSLGDLGQMFPSDPRTPRGIASADLLVEVVGRVAGDGWRVASVDVTIVAARPRLGAHLATMRRTIAGLLGLDESSVSVKASTGNLIGDEGAGRAISAQAIATVLSGSGKARAQDLTGKKPG